MKKFMLATAMLTLLVAGCGEGNGYGDKGILEGTDGTESALRPTTTLAPEPTVPPVTAAPDEPTATTRPARTTTAKPAAQAYPVKIQSDQSTTQFEPRVAQVFAGTPVTWTNTDSVPRSIEFSDGSYNSGPIAPGASVTFTANRAGEFNYSDGTRPYAVGTLRVQAR